MAHHEAIGARGFGAAELAVREAVGAAFTASKPISVTIERKFALKFTLNFIYPILFL